jgi:hypothetical protein
MFFVFYLFDDGMALLIHLLLGGFEDDCFFVSANAPNCTLIEAKNTSRYKETENFLILLLKHQLTIFQVPKPSPLPTAPSQGIKNRFGLH